MLGAVIGLPVAAIAYFFLEAVSRVQTEIFTDLPGSLGFHGEPIWWPLPWLALSGILVAAAIRYLPGTGGHEPSEGFKAGGPVSPIDLFGMIAAAFATLSLGVVLGPEAPLIAIGSGLGVLAVHLFKKDAPAMASVVIGGAGSFAAIATLLGSPLVGAFLLMEVIGLGGATMEMMLLPGLLAAGVGSLIFVGLSDLTGFGTFSLNIPKIPHVGSPTGAEFLWAVGIGLAAAVLATVIFRIARLLRPIVAKRRLLLTPVVGLAVGGLAIAFAEATGRSSSDVLFSGTVGAPEARPAGGQLDGGSIGPAPGLQVVGVRHLAEQLPRRANLPGDVHRCGRRHRPLAPCRSAHDRGCGNGSRGHDRRSAQTAPDRGAAPEPALRVRRPAVDAGGDRGGRRFLRHGHLDQPESGRHSQPRPSLPIPDVAAESAASRRSAEVLHRDPARCPGSSSTTSAAKTREC